MYLIDTDILTLFQRGDPHVVDHASKHPAGAVTIAIITVEEQLTGWYTTLRRVQKPVQVANTYQRLTNAVTFLARFQILSFNEPAIIRYEKLRVLHRRIGKNDLRIASIALEHGATLVTRNHRDFKQIDGLTIEDWSK
jgi:tRNA(fMet)-specific endonuclease VapC